MPKPTPKPMPKDPPAPPKMTAERVAILEIAKWLKREFPECSLGTRSSIERLMYQSQPTPVDPEFKYTQLKNTPISPEDAKRLLETFGMVVYLTDDGECFVCNRKATVAEFDEMVYQKIDPEAYRVGK